jgi:hypothetical protein
LKEHTAYKIEKKRREVFPTTEFFNNGVFQQDNEKREHPRRKEKRSQE